MCTTKNTKRLIKNTLSMTQGLTLIEVLVVIAIMMLIASFSSAQMGELLRRKSINQTAQNMVTTLNLALESAMRRSDVVVVCPGVSQTQCQQDWNQGWSAYGVDLNQAALTLQPLKRFDAPNRKVLVVTNAGQFQFSSDGFLLATQTQKVVICHPDTTDYWVELTLELSGLVAQTNHFFDGVNTQCK